MNPERKAILNQVQEISQGSAFLENFPRGGYVEVARGNTSNGEHPVYVVTYPDGKVITGATIEEINTNAA